MVFFFVQNQNFSGEMPNFGAFQNFTDVRFATFSILTDASFEENKISMDARFWASFFGPKREEGRKQKNQKKKNLTPYDLSESEIFDISEFHGCKICHIFNFDGRKLWRK